MGVKNLWQVMLPIGRRIDVETLEGQILAGEYYSFRSVCIVCFFLVWLASVSHSCMFLFVYSLLCVNDDACGGAVQWMPAFG